MKKNEEIKELSFSLALKEIPVKLVTKEGVQKVFTLVELDGSQRDSFMQDMADRIEFQGGKVSKITNFEGMQSNLLAMCLYDDKKQLIPIEELNKFPAGVLTELFKTAQKISGLELTEEEMKRLKNE
jgi:hypothetical protein